MRSRSTIAGYPGLTKAEELFREKKNDAASMVLIEHLREHRDEPRGLALLGEIAMDSGALAQAEQFLRRAIALGARSYEVKRNLASTIMRLDRLDEALEAFTQLEQHYDDLHLTATRANLLDRLGRTQESLTVHERVTADPRCQSNHWIMYGHTLRFAGQTDKAIGVFREIVAREPDRGEAWWGLADIKSSVLTDEDIETLEKQAEAAVDILNLVPIHMALGRGLHDRGKYDRAFHHYREGNRLRAELINYDPDELTREVDQFIRMTPPGRLGPPQSAPGPIPVFLISLPRSGSTLLEQILGRHPQIEAVGELPHSRALMRASLELHMRNGPLQVFEYLERLTSDEKRMLGSEYMRRAAAHRQTNVTHFIDKMPSNWSDLLFIRAILPQARFVEIRRDALDCCFSNYVHHFGAAHAASFDLGHQGRLCADYTRLMDHLNSAAPGMICTIGYEELIDQPERELTRVLDYLGLEWDEALLRFYESDRSVRTPSAEQVRRPLNRSGIGTWKPYAEWLEPLREALGPLANT